MRSPVTNALVALVDVAGDERRGLRVGAGDDDRRHAATSAASRAAMSVLMCWPVGISTLPPRWPHFFSEASWSSQCTPAAPAAIIAFISSNAFSGAAEAGFGVGDDRREPVGAVALPSAHSIWSARAARC